MPRGPSPTSVALLAAAALAAIVLAIVLGGGRGATSPQPSSAGGQSGFDGAPLPRGVPVHAFALEDQDGRRLRLSDLRGRVVVLAFLYAGCGASCIVIAEQIRGALDELRHPPPTLIVSVDPRGDTKASVARFLARVSLTGRVRYLTGPASRLRAVWRAYGVTPAGAGSAAFSTHASVFLLDRSGAERVIFQPEQLTPEALAHDIGRLEGG